MCPIKLSSPYGIGFKLHPETLVVVFFGGVLLLGLVIYRDFGMFIDDPNQKTMGEYIYDFIFLGDHTFFGIRTRYYGVIFELLLTHIVTSVATYNQSRYLLPPTFREFLCLLFRFDSAFITDAKR